ncbi:MAG: hypothetical protein MJZ37_06530 [Bacilli bacterium]|nr:hypothetical protein [Bacilli bacterium]
MNFLDFLNSKFAVALVENVAKIVLVSKMSKCDLLQALKLLVEPRSENSIPEVEQ